jgi:hypothetical protein
MRANEATAIIMVARLRTCFEELSVLLEEEVNAFLAETGCILSSLNLKDNGK